MINEIFSRIPKSERNDLIIAWVGIAIAFTLVFIRGARHAAAKERNVARGSIDR